MEEDEPTEDVLYTCNIMSSLEMRVFQEPRLIAAVGSPLHRDHAGTWMYMYVR